MKTLLAATLLAGGLLLAGCSGQPAASTAEPVVYRGTVSEVTDDGDILVTQLEGHDYGQPQIRFHLTGDTALDTENGELVPDAYVEVWYSGALTRSLPPQATATAVTTIASFSEGIVQNGTIRQVQATNTGYTINILPIGTQADPEAGFEGQVILIVPADALEDLAEADLVEGAEISAVTRGIAALSMPPQMPVVALLPYTAGMAAATQG